MLRHATLAILALACDAFMLQPAAPAHRPAASLCAASSVSPFAARATVLEMAAKPKVRRAPVATKKAPAKKPVAAKKPAAKTSSPFSFFSGGPAKKPAAKPAAKKPVAKRPAPVRKPVAKPVAKKPVAKRPAPVRKPVAKKPVAKRPAPVRKPAARPAARKSAGGGDELSDQLKNLFSLSLVKSSGPAKSGPVRKTPQRSGSVVRTINRKGAPAPRTRDGLVAEARTGRTLGEEASFLAGQTVDAVGGLNPILVNPVFYAVAAVSATPTCVRDDRPSPTRSLTRAALTHSLARLARLLSLSHRCGL